MIARLRSVTFRDVVDILMPLCLLLTMYLAYLAVSTQGALEREVKRNQARAIVAEGNSKEVLDALCEFRDGIEFDLGINRAALVRARNFLQDHPNGTEDFPKALLEASVERQEATVTAQESRLANLENLDCEES